MDDLDLDLTLVVTQGLLPRVGEVALVYWFRAVKFLDHAEAKGLVLDRSPADGALRDPRVRGLDPGGRVPGGPAAGPPLPRSQAPCRRRGRYLRRLGALGPGRRPGRPPGCLPPVVPVLRIRGGGR